MEPPKLSVRIVDETGHGAHADNDAEAMPAAIPAPSRATRRRAGAVVAGETDLPDSIAALPSADRRHKLRVIEALVFAASEPVGEPFLASHLEAGSDVCALIEELKGAYAGRGVNLVRIGDKWAFRTAEDLGYLLERHAVEERRLSKAALETLAIVAYHQPVTRAEIEEIRGVETSKGTLDILLETGWVRPRGRRRAPGKPLTFGTTDAFLAHFTLPSIKDLPGLADLRSAGLLDSTLPADFKVPSPTDVAALMPDELPLDDEPEAEQAELDLDAGEDTDVGVRAGDSEARASGEDGT